ncbi:hypothetical protein GOBAR_AA15102 [Gossypium barbadense]|uniref:Secreted protein n=1 Tax=Gossypium barbadense TaxID=3634 RepID=A0A2P5XQC3_GOSBA|nr:hypothetical protein GOBAR_AA15102 [Gossypium barbadense]
MWVLQSKWAWAVVASAWAVAAGVRRVGVWGADGDGHAGVCWYGPGQILGCNWLALHVRSERPRPLRVRTIFS